VPTSSTNCTADYQTPVRAAADRPTNRNNFTLAKLRRLADLPKLGTYWISTLGMMHRHTSLATTARRGRRSGFTLIEAAIVTAIVGIGIVGLLELLAAGSMANINSKQLTTAVFLANNVNEMMQGQDYTTLKATFDNKTYAPPKDGRGVDLAGFDTWKQIVDVSYVLPNRLTTVVPDTQVEATSRVTVKIVANDEIIYQTQWIVAAPE
jgi:type II secretory pathway pseudopilin PulG